MNGSIYCEKSWFSFDCIAGFVQYFCKNNIRNVSKYLCLPQNASQNCKVMYNIEVPAYCKTVQPLQIVNWLYLMRWFFIFLHCTMTYVVSLVFSNTPGKSEIITAIFHTHYDNLFTIIYKKSKKEIIGSWLHNRVLTSSDLWLVRLFTHLHLVLQACRQSVNSFDNICYQTTSTPQSKYTCLPKCRTKRWDTRCFLTATFS